MARRWIYRIFRRLKRGRILFLFVFFVLLPTVPLAYLASRVLGGDPPETAEEINEHLERAGLALRKSLTETVRKSAEELCGGPEEELDWDELIELTGAAGPTGPFFREFFILDSDFHLRFPFSPRKREITDALEVIGSDQSPPEFAFNLAAGNRQEFVAGDLGRARLAYRKAVESADDELTSALALQALGRCCCKEKDYRKGADCYRQLLASGDTPFFLGGLSLDLIARFRLGEIAELQGEPGEAFRRYLGIIRELSRGRLAGSVSEASFYASRIRERAGELMRSGAPSPGEISDYEKVLAAWEERKESALKMGSLGEAARQQLAQAAEEAAASGRSRIIKINENMEGALLCRNVSDPESGAPLLLAAAIDPDGMLAALRTALEKTPDGSADVNFEVYDGRGKLMARRGDPEADSRYRATASLEPLFPAFELHLAYRKGGPLLELSRRARMTDLGYILFLLLIILLGLYSTHRLIKKDSELSRLKSDFVSRVSHDLRTPLATIRAVGEMLEMGAVSSREKEKEYFSFIASESERLSRLIDNVLDFSRIEAMKKRYVFRTVPIQKTISDTVRAFREYSRAEGFEIIYRGDDGIPPIPIDEDAVSQALINLLDNAVKFSRDEKVVEVYLSRSGDKVLLSVRDRGVGIAPEHLKRIFDEFYRLREARQLTTEGAGLGLAIVRHIARAHGGDVEVESRVGEGSTFTLVFPRRLLADPAKDKRKPKG